MSNDDATCLDPQGRDYLIGAGDEEEMHQGNLFAHDLINLHCKLWLLGKRDISEDDYVTLAKHVMKLTKVGSPYTLPSSTAAADSFFSRDGRFLKKEQDGEKITWTEVDDEDVIKLLTKVVEEEYDLLEKACYTKEADALMKSAEESKTGDEKAANEESKTDDNEAEETKTKGSKRQKSNSGKARPSQKANKPEEGDVVIKPSIDDVVLVRRKDEEWKSLIDHAGNAFFMLELSQFFTAQYMLSTSTMKGSRADASLAIIFSLLGPIKDDGKSSDTYKTRFLLRPEGHDDLGKKDTPETWQLVSYTDAAEFSLSLLFEKLVYKQSIAAALDKPQASDADAGKDGASEADTAGPSTVPIKNYTDQDVLFGRGGLTNSHPGNRRFRDIILLHRPDYVRAVKVEKPNVARRIVKAIRYGNPPGRFLKKDSKKGMWFDVGDRHAAEKTSQALREKTKVEKSDKFDDEKRKRLRSVAAAQPFLPIPALTPQALQQMVQAGASFVSPHLVGVAFGTYLPAAVATAKLGDSGAAKDGMKSTAGEDGKGDGKEGGAVHQEGVDAEGNILVTDSDVIAGRGGRSNHHPGNKRFRDIVSLHRPDYVRAAKIHKPAVARMIVRALRNSEPPGRFLKKDEKTGKWYDIGDKKAAEKASQALREKTPEERDLRKQDAANGMPLTYFTDPALYQATAAIINGAVPGLAAMPIPGMPAGGDATGNPAAAAAAVVAAVSAARANEEAAENAKPEGKGEAKDKPADSPAPKEGWQCAVSI